jgi:peptide/nickel transport system substrate-binding protein
MKEHPIVTATKILLLAAVALLLAAQFAAHNDTQKKVIVTAQRVDELRDQVVEASRRMREFEELKAKVEEMGATLDGRFDALQRKLESGTVAVRSEAGAPPPPPPTPAPAEGRARLRELLSSEPPRPRPPDDEIDWGAELRVASLSEPKGFNVFTTNRDRFVATDLGYYVYTPLAFRKESNKDSFKPGLAVRALQSEDRTEYFIHLRKGVRWHRPPVDLDDPKYAWMRGDHEVTADDLVFSLDMIFDARADTQVVRPNFDKIVEYRAIDPHTLYVRWKEPNFYSTGVLLGDLVPLPRWIYTREEDGTPIDPASVGKRFGDHWFNKKMCGYGAYRFKEYKLGESVTLERNESWWGRRPGYKTIYYRLALREDEPRYNTFMSRDASGRRLQDAYPMSSTRLKRDVLENDGSSELRKQLAARELFFFQYTRPMYAYTGWACRGKFFNDPRVRRAMTMAANREAWAKEILLGEAEFGTGIAFLYSPEYDRSIQPWPYDLDAASRLLTEAGWRDTDGNGVRDKEIDGEKVEFRFKALLGAGSSPEIDAMRDDWRDSLRRIGVVMEYDFAEWNLFTKKCEDRQFDSYSMAWYHADDFKPDNIFHSRLIAQPGSYNMVEWSNARADEIMDALCTTFDLEKRYALCHELHRIFHEEQPYTILWTWKNTVAWDSGVGGLQNPRPFTPAVDFLDLYRVKTPPAKYDDGRYEVPRR